MLEEKITNTIKSSIHGLGYELVKVMVKGDLRKTVEVLIDRLDGNPAGVQDCKIVSKNISAILDVEDLIDDKYFLEVSSAGIERPLVNLEDYVKFMGRYAKIVLKIAQDDRSKYKGKIIQVQNDNIELQLEDNHIVSLSFDNIKKANLAFTDEMFKELLKKSERQKR